MIIVLVGVCVVEFIGMVTYAFYWYYDEDLIVNTFLAHPNVFVYTITAITAIHLAAVILAAIFFGWLGLAIALGWTLVIGVFLAGIVIVPPLNNLTSYFKTFNLASLFGGLS